MTLYLILIVIVFTTIYILKKNKKDEVEKVPLSDKPLMRDNIPLTRHNNSSTNKTTQTHFIPYKIVENDNTLRTLVDDYDVREKESIKDFETRLGKALPNDVKWSILQDLAIEGIEKKDTKLCINVEYQRGLLVQKEKKYKQAISHYSMGLYYLMNFYPHKFNPRGHLIDYVKNDYEVIEMAQEKFINKIKLCVKYSNISLDDLFESVQRITTVTVLKKVSPIELLQEIILATRDFYLPKGEDIDGNKIEIEMEFNYNPASFKNRRTELRDMIRNTKKNKEPLEEILNEYYNLCVKQQVLYGYYPTKTGVNGFYGSIINIMLKNINLNDFKFSFINNGYIDKSEFISQNDYKTFVKCFGPTDKSTDYKLIYDSDFENSINEYKNKKFDEDDDFGKVMFLETIDEHIKLANNTRNNTF
ncbi:hypothetical protein JHD49_03375 [Sulfurimonas sp. SAG-AH-194-C21]|nr:hypothetical protein [Sulfurimonas sp. SAG-AH-194-C21]MDF1882970.1 hypothetical protein [Sulfurimonas sp. SAG-AH-194-C21]